jgi:hypothetical protein
MGIYWKNFMTGTEIFEDWFISCWDKIHGEYNNIPKAFFSIHDTIYK